MRNTHDRHVQLHRLIYLRSRWRLLRYSSSSAVETIIAGNSCPGSSHCLDRFRDSSASLSFKLWSSADDFGPVVLLESIVCPKVVPQI
jgi:hypothetical protein